MKISSIAFKFLYFCVFSKNLKMSNLILCLHQNVVQEANNAWIVAFGLIDPSSCSRT